MRYTLAIVFFSVIGIFSIASLVGIAVGAIIAGPALYWLALRWKESFSTASS